MVEAVVLPKARRMPKKAAAPKPREVGKAGKKVAAPIIKDQMVLKTKTEEKKEGEDRTPEEKPEKQPKKKKSRADLLAARTQETSDKPIFETSVDGDKDVKPDKALASKFGKPMSAYERRIHDRVKDNWFPKFNQTQPDPSLWAVVSFDIDDSGNISGPSLGRRSGDRVFNSSCLRAVARTRRVPPPPQDAPRRFHIRFSPEDKK
jgi:TonB family protein